MSDLTLAVDNTVLERFDILQAREVLAVHVVARELVDRTLGQSWEDTDRRLQARARYLATHAMRSMSDGWEQEARRRAKEAVIRALRTECGSTTRDLSQAHYDALAGILVSAVLDTAKGVTEGSSPITPGDYCRIVGLR